VQISVGKQLVIHRSLNFILERDSKRRALAAQLLAEDPNAVIDLESPSHIDEVCTIYLSYSLNPADNAVSDGAQA